MSIDRQNVYRSFDRNHLHNGEFMKSVNKCVIENGKYMIAIALRNDQDYVYDHTNDLTQLLFCFR